VKSIPEVRAGTASTRSSTRRSKRVTRSRPAPTPTRSSRDARRDSNASRAAQTLDATWSKSTKMESRRCVRQSRDANEAIPEPPKGDGHPGPRLRVSPAPTRRSKHGDQGQEHEEEHGKEAGSKDAEREAAGQEGQEVAGPVEQPALPEVRWLPGPPQPRSAPEQS